MHTYIPMHTHIYIYTHMNLHENLAQKSCDITSEKKLHWYHVR